MRRVLICMIVFAILITPIKAYGQAKTVQVRLPEFSVTINGEVIENDTRSYPLIVYKDVTYFPMTYYDARFLGIETLWDQNTGLKVNKTGILGGYRTYSGQKKNKKTDNAVIPTFNIEINGKVVDNTKETYPLLSYKNVTYFPMTWKWAVEEFGWKYSFDTKKGLSIQSEITVERIGNLSSIKSDVFVCAEGYCYYSDGQAIYQKSIADDKPAKKMYQLEIWSYGDGTTYVSHSLYKEDGKVMLFFHQGGAIMGYDQYIQLNSNGSYEEIASGYLLVKRFNDFTIEAYQGPMPSENNMIMKQKDGTVKFIGNPDYLYGWVWHKNEDAEGGVGSNGIYLYNNVLYVLAFNMKQDTDTSRIHKVNLATNETERVSNLITEGFKADGDKLYCISDGKLYEISTESGSETKLDVNGTIEQYEIMNGRVYYIDGENKRLNIVGHKDVINPTGKALSLNIEDNYVVCTFAEESTNPYRLMVFDAQGNVVYKTADVVLNIIGIDNGQLSYIENYTRNIYTVNLK